MASRSIFVFTILLSLVLVSCHSSRSVDPTKKKIQRACRKTNDYNFCVSTLKSNQRRIASDPKIFTRILIRSALSKVNEATTYIEKTIYYQEDMVFREYLALCLDEYAKAEKKLKKIEYTLASGQDYTRVSGLFREIATHATSCQEAFERKEAQSVVNYKPPKPCPLSLQNKSIQQIAQTAAGLLA